MNDEMTQRQRCQREETERKLRFIKESKVKITDSVTIETDSEFKLPRLLKPAGVSPLREEKITGCPLLPWRTPSACSVLTRPDI